LALFLAHPIVRSLTFPVTSRLLGFRSERLFRIISDWERDLSPQNHPGLWSGLRELFGLLSAHRRREFYLVLALMLTGGLAELATIGSVLPFLSLLADPDSLQRFPPLAKALDSLVAITGAGRLATATGAFILIAIVAAAVRLQLAWSSQSFTFRAGHELAVEIQRRLLLQPYAYYASQNSSSILASLEKTQLLVFNVLQQVMLAGTSLFISILITAALIYVDPPATLAVAAGFAAVYAMVSAFTRRRLRANSVVINSTYDERFKIVQESFGGIRDIIIDNSQPEFLNAFRRADERFNAARANTAFISAAPRFIVEALGMILIAIVAILISRRDGGLALALPVLGALALGAQRVLPLLQQIHVSWSLAVGHSAILGQVLALLRLPAEPPPARADEVSPLALRKGVSVRHVSFSYPGRRSPALHDVSLEIPSGRSVALIGKTGSGKSTLVDLLMGLLEPDEGQIAIDGVRLTGENRRRWQRNIAHVPQAIFLADTSIARNVAFGVPPGMIDLDRVIEASIKAQLHEFVTSLPEGYDTRVGERGIRLSGGQRQRLGIARAIYKQASVLVLDEATSALDDATEKAVMSALERLGEEGRTIIMIAHRLSTVSRADLVVRLDNGRVVEQGRFAEIVGHSGSRAVGSGRNK
jgi:ABC-type multidrug transport system fused ATPase/permease subunit